MKYRSILVPPCSKTITFAGLDAQVAAYWTPRPCQKEAKVAPKGQPWGQRRQKWGLSAPLGHGSHGNEWKRMETNEN